jgi:hypothetical protein
MKVAPPVRTTRGVRWICRTHEQTYNNFLNFYPDSVCFHTTNNCCKVNIVRADIGCMRTRFVEILIRRKKGLPMAIFICGAKQGFPFNFVKLNLPN